MNGPAASVSVRADGGTTVVKLAGEIDLANAEDIARQIDVAITNHQLDAVVDVSGVTYIDSVGVRFLFTLVRRLGTAQIGIRFIAPAGTPARRMIELSGLAAIAHIEPPFD